jgi:hypothetical protein
MRKRLQLDTTCRILLLALAAAPFGSVHAQEATEQFIPIGESPGVSGTESYTGEIMAVDSRNREVSIQAGSRERTIKVVPETRIWLDRSERRRENTEASFSACQVGRRVEIMPRDDAEDVAAWIKVEQN